MSYVERLQRAQSFASENNNYSGVRLATMLYEQGHSLRIIEDITGISRSKLQRFFSQNGVIRTDEYQTQKKQSGIETAKKLWNEGATVKQIAEKLNKHPRTIEAYLRQCGVFARSNIKF